MSEDLATQIGGYVQALDEAQLPVTLAELTHSSASNYRAGPADLSPTAAPPAVPIDTHSDPTPVEADEHPGDRPSVDVLWEDVVRPTPSERGRWSGVATVVAAALLVVAGVLVVADANSSDVVTDPASGPGATDPPVSSPAAAAAAAAADPVEVPSVTAPAGVDEDVFVAADMPGCEIPQGWAQVCDAATFDGAAMYAVTAGGPGLVAVGGEDNEYYTREGYTPDWDGWIGVADAVVLTSPDGLTWTRVRHDEAVFGGDGSQQMFGVAAGGPGLVAVGRDGPALDGEGHAAVWTSSDGLAWSRVLHDEAVFGGPGEQRMVSVTVGGPGLVAVGFDRTPGNDEGDAAVWTSPDGLSWSRVAHDEAVFGGTSRQMMLGVTVGGPGLVAVGIDGIHDSIVDGRIDESAADAAVWTSPDGLAWSRVAHDEAVFGGPGEQRMASVTVGGPGLVAVGRVTENVLLSYKLSDAAVWTSPDGLTWARVPDDEAVFSTSGASGDLDEDMLSVTAGGPGLVAVGFDSVDDCGWDSAVWTSPDGLTWSRVPDERNCNPGPYDRMLSVTVGPSGLVAVGEEHHVQAAAVWNG